MLSKKGFESFRQEAEQVLQEIAKKYDVDIKAGHISYTTNSFELKLEVTKKEVNGKSFEQAEFEKECTYYGLKPEDYGKQFKSNGHTYTIYGINGRARSMPIRARREDGALFKFGGDTVKRLLTV